VSIRDRITLFPTPAQGAGIPLLVGGMADVSLRRAAAHGDGWLAITFLECLDVDPLRERVQRVRELRARTGNGPFEVVLKLHAQPESALELPEAVAAIAGLGVDETIVDAPWTCGVDRACEILAACRNAAGPQQLSLGDGGS
jgi:alkanesulfonate monooxygenase SsuD/methylene tetrahydromethanopterin reductase-like flavin-dependent oxidoreductase (luciferase family)